MASSALNNIISKIPIVKNIIGGGVSTKQLTTFTSQLSTLQDAGLPIVRSLKILQGQMKRGTLKSTVGTVAEDIESGSTFSDALSKHPIIFDKLFVNMVKAGEIGGVLDTILRRLSEFMEKSQKLKKRIAGAAIYPAAVITVAGAILVAIMILVVPQFEKIFKDVKIPLPAITAALITMSNGLKESWYVIPIFIGGVYIGFQIFVSYKAGKYIMDRVVISMPIFGDIVRKSSISRLTRTLGTLVTSGVPILEALGIVRNAIANQVIANAVVAVQESIRGGESIAEPLAQSGEFDDIVVNMIDVGEETGELDKMLMKIADNYDEEVDVLVGSMVSLLEPMMIIVMGVAIGFIVLALFLPLISLMEKMG